MKRYLDFIIPVFLLLVIPVTYYFAKRPQTIIQKAAPATSVYFSPNNINVSANSNFTLNADLSSGTNQIAAVELNIKFNPAAVRVNSIALPQTPFLPNISGSPSINNTSGTARVILLSNPDAPKIGTGTLVTISLTGLQTGSTQVSFDTATTKAGAVNEPTGTNVIISWLPAQITVGGNSSPSPTARPSPSPTVRPSPSPTARPSPSPTVRPSPSPTARPTPSPTPTVRPSPSPTARPSPSPTSGPSSTPGTASLVLKIRFEGVTTSNTGKTVRVILKQNNTVRFSQNIVMTGNSTGVYANTNNLITGFTPGTYDVFVKGPVHLTKKFGGQTLSSGNNTLDFSLSSQMLLAGDAVIDDAVNVYDYGNLIDNYKCGSNPPPANKNCTSMLSDYNYNGIIDIYDYNYMIGNFELVGDQ